MDYSSIYKSLEEKNKNFDQTGVWIDYNDFFKNTCNEHLVSLRVDNTLRKKNERYLTDLEFRSLMVEWDWIENYKNGLDPAKLTFGSGKTVQWVCLKAECGCHHRWSTTIYYRASNGGGCPFCSNKKVCVHNSLTGKFPELIKEWDFVKNGDLDPSTVQYGSTRIVHWVCLKSQCGCIHSWSSTINNRTNANILSGCPWCCNLRICFHQSLEFKFPEISKEWDYENNGTLTPSTISYSNHAIINWICKKSKCGCIHSWKAPIYSRTGPNLNGCPWCRHTKVCIHESLGYIIPTILEEWDYEKNNIDPFTIAPYSHCEVNWICKKNNSHKWKTSISTRTSQLSGCPFCLNKTEQLVSDFLSTLYSDTIRQKRFSDLKYINELPFDFYIDELKIVIEVDGAQHFRQVLNWETPEHNRARDKFKMEYCQNNCIKVFRLVQERVFKFDGWKKSVIEFIASGKNFGFWPDDDETIELYKYHFMRDINGDTVIVV